MATMIVKHRVASYDKWKVVFDEMTAGRKEHGWIGHELYRDATDPNLVVVVNHMQDLASAKRYGGSDALRSAMARGGIQGAPEIVFLDDVEHLRY